MPLDLGALAEMSAYFAALARRLRRQVGEPREHDASVYRHQLPGGMTSTLRRQLAEIGMEHRWDEVLEELPRVREALGWPIMVTPLSQFVGVQAFLNVTSGERWSQFPDEIVRYDHKGPEGFGRGYWPFIARRLGQPALCDLWRTRNGQADDTLS